MRGREVIKILILILLTTVGQALPGQHPPYKNFTIQEGLPSNTIYSIVRDQKGYMWFATADGLAKFNGLDFKVFKDPDGSSEFFNLQEDAKGRVWWLDLTEFELGYIYEDSLIKISDYFGLSGQIMDFSIADDSTFLILGIDRLWVIRSKESGLDYTVVKEEPETVFLSLKSFNNNHLLIAEGTQQDTSTIVKIFPEKIPAKCSVWLTASGIYAGNHHEGQLYRYDGYRFEKFDSSESHFGKPAGITNISAIDNQVWAGTYLGVINLTTGSTYFPGIGISAIYQDLQENLWFGSLKNGVYCIPDITTLLYKKEDIALPDNHLKHIDIHPDGSIAIGGFNGDIGIIKPDRSISKNYFTGVAREIRDLKWDPDQSSEYIYVSNNVLSRFDLTNTTSKNIYKFSENVKSFKVSGGKIYAVNRFSLHIIDESFVLEGHTEPFVNILYFYNHNQVITTVHDRDQDKLWMAKRDGIFYCYNGEMIKYDTKVPIDYMTSVERDTTGTLWFGTLSGVLAVDEKSGRQIVFSKEDGLLDNQVKKLKIYKNQLWVLFENGKLQAVTDPLNFSHSNTKVFSYDFRITDIAFHLDTLWATTSEGLLSLPVGKIPFEKPHSVQIEKVLISNSEISSTKPLILNYSDNFVEFITSSFEFFDPDLYYLAYRLKGSSSRWITSPLSDPKIQFLFLSPGDYEFEIKIVSKAGKISSPSKNFNFKILPPFWERWWFILLVISGVGGIAGLMVRSRIIALQKQSDLQKKLRIMQSTAIRSQMNPHFIFNSLNSIQYLFLSKDFETVSLYLGHFSQLLRKFLHYSEKENIQLSEEIDILKHYLELEALRFQDDFKYSIDIEFQDKTASPEDIFIPTMLVQPFVENALKHGLLHKEGRKRLDVKFKIDEFVRIEVADNGIGRTKSRAIVNRKNKYHQSFATDAINRRIELLEAQLKQKIIFETGDLNPDLPDPGTLVMIQIPLIIHED